MVSMSQGFQQQNSVVRPGSSVVQLSHAAQQQNSPRMTTNTAAPLRPTLQRPMGPVIRVQAARAQSPSVQYANAVRPLQGGLLAQTLTMAGKAGADTANKNSGTQVVQVRSYEFSKRLENFRPVKGIFMCIFNDQYFYTFPKIR